ncbi:MAG: ABC transporter ATP-binding protein [Chthonomonas sp.]|nr:ABC transporter ATP-binding protein [Chthonomonas sp.]
MLIAKELGKRFGSRWVFRGLQFQVSSGQVLGVFGSNGSGKSTLLRVLAGLATANEGEVALSGEVDLRRSVGYAALDLALYPDLTAQEHLDLAARLRGGGTKGWLERVGLPADQPTREFSSGMRARLRLAISMQHEPLMLLLDEPGASLDEAGRSLVQDLITEQCERGVVVLATNEPNEKEWANHAITLG